MQAGLAFDGQCLSHRGFKHGPGGCGGFRRQSVCVDSHERGMIAAELVSRRPQRDLQAQASHGSPWPLPRFVTNTKPMPRDRHPLASDGANSRASNPDVGSRGTEMAPATRSVSGMRDAFNQSTTGKAALLYFRSFHAE